MDPNQKLPVEFFFCLCTIVRSSSPYFCALSVKLYVKKKKKNLRTLAPSWTEAKQARAARKEAKVPRRRVYLSGARMAFG